MADPKTRKSKYAPGANVELYKMLSHPLRFGILMALGERTASPKELSEDFEEDLHAVAEQVRILKKSGFVELVDTDTRNGGRQHFYCATVRPMLDAEEWARLPKLAQQSTTITIFKVIMENAIAAIETGDFDAHPHRALLEKPIIVDDEGFKEADESALRHLAELAEIEARSAGRLIAKGQEGIAVKTATIVHQAAPDPERRTGPDVWGKRLSEGKP
jgi:hypothetical protein